MEAFGRVQTIAQNPRCRTTVPLHKKLVNFIKTFQHKWRSMDVRLAEEAKHLTGPESCATTQTSCSTTTSSLNDLIVKDNEMCFLPKPGVTIHRPLLSITEYLSSVNICLTAYEERIGVKPKGEQLNNERCNSSTTLNNTPLNSNISTGNKRLRTESGSEKRSPEQMKRIKSLDNSYENVEDAHSSNENDSFNNAKNESSGDELSDEIQELLSDSNEINTSKEFLTIPENNNPPQPPPLPPPPPPAVNVTENTNANCITQLNTTTSTSSGRSKRSLTNKTTSSRSVFKPLLNDDVIQRIRSGWTSSTAGDITIGDLYVVFGHDSKLELDYYWKSDNKNNTQQLTKSESQDITANNLKTAATKQFHNGTNDCDENNLQNSLESSGLSNKLKQLLLIANLSEGMRRRPCTCDHRNNAAKVKVGRKTIFLKDFY